MNTDLKEQTLTMLQNRSARLQLQQISDDTGLSYPWICAFHQGRIKKYDHQKVEEKIKKLHSYLVSKQKEQHMLPL